MRTWFMLVWLSPEVTVTSSTPMLASAFRAGLTGSRRTRASVGSSVFNGFDVNMAGTGGKVTGQLLELASPPRAAIGHLVDRHRHEGRRASHDLPRLAVDGPDRIRGRIGQ